MEVLKKLAQNFINLDTKEILFRTVSNNPQLEKLAIKLNQENQLKFGFPKFAGFVSLYEFVSLPV